jgi:hypothetical protein
MHAARVHANRLTSSMQRLDQVPDRTQTPTCMTLIRHAYSDYSIQSTLTVDPPQWAEELYCPAWKEIGMHPVLMAQGLGLYACNFAAANVMHRNMLFVSY